MRDILGLGYDTSALDNFTLNTNNNIQAFYSQASWGRLEKKSHEQKKRYKTRANKGKTNDDKNQIKKGEKTIKR
jgi:hypothetical protein